MQIIRLRVIRVDENGNDLKTGKRVEAAEGKGRETTDRGPGAGETGEWLVSRERILSARTTAFLPGGRVCLFHVSEAQEEGSAIKEGEGGVRVHCPPRFVCRAGATRKCVVGLALRGPAQLVPLVVIQEMKITPSHTPYCTCSRISLLDKSLSKQNGLPHTSCLHLELLESCSGLEGTPPLTWLAEHSCLRFRRSRSQVTREQSGGVIAKET